MNDLDTTSVARNLPHVGPGLLTLLLLCAGVWTYRNSLDGRGVFDDNVNVGMALEMYKTPSPISFLPRPRSLVYLSFVLNYKIGKSRVRGFHQVNRLIHILAALALFGVVRRTLRLPTMADRFRSEAADWVAASIALLWLVHPLQTEAVTYMVQRIESSMALVYLLCFYSLIRGAVSRHGPRWYLLVIVLYFIGIGTKEVIATAPLLMLLYDRIFLASSWGNVWRRRGWFYGLMLLPIMLFCFYMSTYFNTKKIHNMGLGHPWITPWMYARTQAAVVLHYLRLAFWPDKLCLDYCWPVMSVRQLAVPLLAMGMLLASTLWLLRYRPRIGFLAAGFFLILAPTSSFMPINDLSVEHRMYLPLACVIALVVFAALSILELATASAGWSPDAAHKMLATLAILTAIPLAIRTVARNEDYRTPIAIWKSAVEAYPYSHRAEANYAVTLWQAQRKDEAREHYRRSFDLACTNWVSKDAAAQNFEDLRWALKQTGKSDDIFRILNEGVACHPEIIHYHWFLANECFRVGDYANAVQQLHEVVRIDAGFYPAHVTLATALFLHGHPSEAVSELRISVQLAPNDNAVINYLAWVLATHPDSQVRDGRAAVQLSEEVCLNRKAGDASSWGTLAAAYAEAGRFDAALGASRRSIDLLKGPPAANDVIKLRGQMAHYEKREPYRIKVKDLADQDEGDGARPSGNKRKVPDSTSNSTSSPLQTFAKRPNALMVNNTAQRPRGFRPQLTGCQQNANIA